MIHTLAPSLSALVAASLKGSVLLLVALLAVRAMRRSSAEARHAVLAIGLVGFLLVPVATVAVPAWAVIPLPVVPTNLSAAIDRARHGDDRLIGGADTRRGASDAGVESASAPGAVAPDRGNAESAGMTDTDGGVAPRGASAPPKDLEQSLSAALGMPTRSQVVALVWFLGVAVIGLRLLIGLARLRFLSKRATMVTDGAWLHTAHAIARRLGLTRGVTLLRGDRQAVPMTWGVLSPVVWLPPAADAWPMEVRSSVLSHELAHVRRRDAVMQWIANIAVALHWFNPLIWVATRALRAERERACDDAVLALGAAPDDYAAHLLDMVRALGTRGGPAPAMAMARRSQFEGRLLAILDRACSRAPVGGGRLVIAGAAAAALVLILGAVRAGEAARLPSPSDGELRLAVSSSVLAQPEGATERGGGGRTAGPARRGSGPDGAQRDQHAARGTAETSTSGRGAVDAGPTPSRDSVARDNAEVPAATEIAVPPASARAATAVHQVTPPPSAGALASVLGPALPQARTLSRSDTALLLDVIAAAEGITSSSDRVAVLQRVASLPDLAPTVVTALGRAASRVTSSTARTQLLRTLIRKQPHAVGESRRAVLDALSHELNSTDFGAALEDFVKRDNITDAALADAFTAAAKITSSTEKARVLVAAARHRKPDGSARSAYLKTAGTITNGSDRARALSALFDDPPTERQSPAK